MQRDGSANTECVAATHENRTVLGAVPRVEWLFDLQGYEMANLKKSGMRESLAPPLLVLVDVMPPTIGVPPLVTRWVAAHRPRERKERPLEI